MLIDEKTRTVLTGKLHFTDDHIKKMENNAGIAARTINLLNMIQRSPGQKPVRQFVQVQLQNIRKSLDEVPERNDVLLMARAEYYTFRRSLR